MKKYIRGFTLIELLVVIAIIGILASVVLVSLNSARKKGNDTRVISDVNQLRTQLESDYNGADYRTGFTNDNVLSAANNYGTIMADANLEGGVTPDITVVTTGTYPAVTGYAIYGKLVSPATATYFCIDSKGNTNPAATVITGQTCPAVGS